MVSLLLAGVAFVLGTPPSAVTPPRGWNSYDSYTWKVSEADFLANCAAMSQKLGPGSSSAAGYQYCVVDYLWFQDLDAAPASPGGDATGVGGMVKVGETSRTDHRERTAPLLDPITTLHIDDYGRLVPAPDRWPSTWSVDRKTSRGFKPVADKVHAMGMKFGIHIMRGISTAAVAAKSPVLDGHGATAADIANTSTAALCPWWKGVMSVNLTHPAGQAFYDSLYTQYADWGVDFIKNDCVFGNQFVPDQIRAQAQSIRKVAAKTGAAPIVYSLSPGSGFVEQNTSKRIREYGHEVNADVNMYRVTGDDWDSWSAVASHFEIAAWCHDAGLVGAPGLGSPGSRSWPDLDMLPFGEITSPNSGRLPYKNSSLTHDQQRAQMTLWSIAKSPLMFGGAAVDLDDFTMSLLGNAEVLDLNAWSTGNRPVLQSDTSSAVWTAERVKNGKTTTYVALFNTGSAARTVKARFDDLGLPGVKSCTATEPWGVSPPPKWKQVDQAVVAEVAATGVLLLALSNCQKVASF